MKDNGFFNILNFSDSNFLFEDFIYKIIFDWLFTVISFANFNKNNQDNDNRNSDRNKLEYYGVVPGCFV